MAEQTAPAARIPEPHQDGGTDPGASFGPGRIGIRNPGLSARPAPEELIPPGEKKPEPKPTYRRWSDWLPPFVDRFDLCYSLLDLQSNLARFHAIATSDQFLTAAGNLRASNLAEPCTAIFTIAMAILDSWNANDFRSRADRALTNLRSPSRSLHCKEIRAQLDAANAIMHQSSASSESRDQARLDLVRISANLVRILDETFYLCADIGKDVIGSLRRDTAVPEDLEAERLEMILEHIGMVLEICGIGLDTVLQGQREERADVTLS